MTDTNTITFRQDKIGGVDWAFLPDSIFGLARFTSTGTMFLVRDPTGNVFKSAEGSFIPITNPKYESAGSYAEFKRKAQAFVDESEREEA